MKDIKVKIKILKDEGHNLDYFFQNKEIDFYGHKIKTIDTNVLLYCLYNAEMYWKYDQNDHTFNVFSKEGNFHQKFSKDEWSTLLKRNMVNLNVEKMIITFLNDFVMLNLIDRFLNLFKKLKIEYKFVENNLDKILSNVNLDEDVDLSDLEKNI